MNEHENEKEKDTCICKHCGQRWGRRRGLCAPCYESHRALYPSYQHASILSCIMPAQLATNSRPGSAEKIRVLTERRANREALWHTEDAKIPMVYTDGLDQKSQPRPIYRRARIALQPDWSGL